MTHLTILVRIFYLVSVLVLFCSLSRITSSAANVSEVSTYAALRALNPSTSDNGISVRYRSSATDGAGGAFFWDSTDTTSSDNDGTVLISTYTPPPSGRWKRIYDGSLNVRWFGALPRPDGSISDDRSAIQQALNVASSMGQELYFPPGIYDVSGSTTPLYLTVGN